jgi:NitT/TauT family transport system ATP-binding protein
MTNCLISELQPEILQETVSRREAVRGHVLIDDVSVVYRRNGATTVALENASANIHPGEFVALLGPSGCGKSTLLNAIAGIVKPTSGALSVDGEEVREPNETRGMIFQQHSLFPWMTALQNVAFGPKMLGAANPEGVGRTFLGLVGLEKFKDLYPAQLSGGMQQRVGIARALATYPPVLLLDEPFGALDAQTRTIMHEELLKIWNSFRTTVVFVTHDVDEAIFLSDRVLVMKTMPGGIKCEIPVDIPRPRTSETLVSPSFTKIRREIISIIREESLRVFNAQ